MDKKQLRSDIEAVWESSIVPTLEDFIRIPNKSPHFDEDWQSHGHMDEAVDLLVGWCNSHAPRGMDLQVLRQDSRTPLIYIEVPASGEQQDTVLLYGHLDKQPEMTGWHDHLGPWLPVREGDKLYGRGGADDGYAVFAAIAALNALQAQGLSHPRCVIIIEACEESGSYDLPPYLEQLEDQIGKPSLVICLDSGCGNYQQLWSTTSLRGVVVGELKIAVLEEGVHSGLAGGVVPGVFQILRERLARIENADSGEIVLPALRTEVPAARLAQVEHAAEVLGNELIAAYPLVPGAKPLSDDPVQSLLSRTWLPSLSVTGIDGVPSVSAAGNVALPEVTVKLSLRIPPNCDASQVSAALKDCLESQPPFGVNITAEFDAAAGWEAPPLADWLEKVTEEASQAFFDKPAMYMGEGGSIPFMGMLGEQYPEAQFLITGVLGPHSNAHGPNEFLHIAMAKKLTCCVSYVLHSIKLPSL